MVVIAGVDEAGRGAVIGPLVMAGVSIEEENLDKIKALGVKDSKDLSQKRRVELSKKIEEIAKDIVVVHLSACKIDIFRKDGINLNQLEAMRMGDILGHLGAQKGIVDSPDVKPERLKLFLEKSIKHDIKIVSEHKADAKYPIVSAASIIAKVEREEAIEKLKKKFGDFGPGYSSNPKTIQWLKDWRKNKGEFPDIVRRSWQTVKDIEKEFGQGKLTGWFKGIRKKEGC